MQQSSGLARCGKTGSNSLLVLSDCSPQALVQDREESLPLQAAGKHSAHPIRKRRILYLLRESKVYAILLTICMCLSFVLDSVRTIAFPKSYDSLIDGIILACVLFFACDIILRMICDAGYSCSVFFWMDLCANLELLDDLTRFHRKFSSECFDLNATRAKIAFRIARLCSGMSRMLRGTCTNRTAPSLTPRLFPSSSRTFPHGSSLCHRPSSDKFRLPDKESNRLSTETFTSRRDFMRMNTIRQLYSPYLDALSVVSLPPAPASMQESAISRVVTRRIAAFLVTVAVLISCAAVANVTPSEMRSLEYGMHLMVRAESAGRLKEMQKEFIAFHTKPGNLHSVISLVYNNAEIYSGDERDELRSADICAVEYKRYTAKVSIVEEIRLYAVFDLCASALVSVLVTAVCLRFSRDFRNMLLFPLERMMHTTQMMAENPLAFVTLSTKRPESTTEDKKKCCEGRKDYAEGEIQLLEDAFRKIGVMLAVVYGSAGSELISSCIRFAQDFSPLIPGRAVTAIFCFARIKHCDSLLPFLRSEILSYINLVAAIVHNTCERYLGSVNRNLGEAFLLVWKVEQEDYAYVHNRPVMNPYSPATQKKAALALIFAVKTIEKAAKSKAVFQHQHSGKLLRRGLSFGSVMSFGLHAGWSYEGAIGSMFKIDATYLSPNVNLASRIESATRQYCVHILASEEMVECLENDVQIYMRHIDTVRLKGVYVPVPLYAFDLSDDGFPLKSSQPSKPKTEQKRNRLHHALSLNLLSVGKMFTASDTIAYMRRDHRCGFYEQFSEGMRLYLSGRWREAISTLEPLADGPARALCRFMRERRLQPPEDWQGVRELMYK